MEPERLVLLRADIEAQLAEIDSIYDRIDVRATVPGEAGAESLAFQLHNLYCAFEDLFQLIAAAFENHIVADGGYHVGLLKRMRVAVPGVRPPVIDAQLFAPLDSLRAFRHFFRHAYGSVVDVRKVELVRQDAAQLRTGYRSAVHQFLQAVESS